MIQQWHCTWHIKVYCMQLSLFAFGPVWKHEGNIHLPASNSKQNAKTQYTANCWKRKEFWQPTAVPFFRPGNLIPNGVIKDSQWFLSTCKSGLNKCTVLQFRTVYHATVHDNEPLAQSTFSLKSLLCKHPRARKWRRPHYTCQCKLTNQLNKLLHKFQLSTQVFIFCINIYLKKQNNSPERPKPKCNLRTDNWFEIGCMMICWWRGLCLDLLTKGRSTTCSQFMLSSCQMAILWNIMKNLVETCDNFNPWNYTARSMARSLLIFTFRCFNHNHY